MQQINYHHIMPSNGAENGQWTATYNPPAPLAYQAAANQQAYYSNAWPVEGTETVHFNHPGPSAYLAGDVCRAPPTYSAYNNGYTHPPLSNSQSLPYIETFAMRGDQQSMAQPTVSRTKHM